jgi:hypothetical protein
LPLAWSEEQPDSTGDRLEIDLFDLATTLTALP